jgi:hypothetical protein
MRRALEPVAFLLLWLAASGQTHPSTGAATATAPAKLPLLTAMIDKLPQDLRPVKGETTLKYQTRVKWYDDNVSGQRADSPKVKVSTVKAKKDGAILATLPAGVTIFGSPYTVEIQAEFDAAATPAIVQLKKNDAVTFTGEISKIYVAHPATSGPSVVRIEMTACVVH